MTVRIMGVHGVGNYDEGATDADRAGAWARHLRAGFGSGSRPEFDVHVAYYAPALHSRVGQGPADVDQLTPDEAQDVWAWLVASGLPDDAVAQGNITRPIRQGLEWFARRFGLDQSVVERLVRRFFPEVSTYFTDPDRREQARVAVADAIDQHRPEIVLAHSLGSIVTYETLWQEPHRRVPLLVTMGSPLALPTVVTPRLQPLAPRAKPPGVTRWINVADPGDLIAILRPLSDHFDGIDADLEPSIDVVDFHLARHYLSSPAIAGLIASAATPRLM